MVFPKMPLEFFKVLLQWFFKNIPKSHENLSFGVSYLQDASKTSILMIFRGVFQNNAPKNHGI